VAEIALEASNQNQRLAATYHKNDAKVHNKTTPAYVVYNAWCAVHFAVE